MKDFVRSRLRQWFAHPAASNFGWLLFDRFGRMAISFIVGTWMVRYLGPGDYGVLNYGLSVTIILGVVPTLGIDLIVRRELVQRPEDTDAILGTTFRLKLVAGVATYLLTVAGACWLEGDHLARFVIIVSGTTLVQHALFTFDNYFHAHLQARNSALAQNIAFALSSAGRVILILRHAPLEAFAWMLLLELPINSALLVWFYRRGGGHFCNWRWSSSLAQRLLAEGWPLAMGAIATMLFARADQVLLTKLRDTTEVGRYAAAQRLFDLFQFLPAALATSLAPALLRARETGPGSYDWVARRFFNRIAQMAWAVALPGMLGASFIVPWLYGEEYRSSSAMLTLLLAALPAMALSLARQQYLINERNTRIQLVMAVSGLSVSLILNWILIPHYGGMGSALAATISHWITGVLLSFAWPLTRPVGQWQLRALFGLWRLPAPSVKVAATAPGTHE